MNSSTLQPGEHFAFGLLLAAIYAPMIAIGAVVVFKGPSALGTLIRTRRAIREEGDRHASAKLVPRVDLQARRK